MKKKWLALLLMVLIVPLAGELKFYPFDGEFSSFRVSFGSPAFLFFLLWIRSTSFAFCGLLAGFSVLLFRILLDGITMDSTFAASCIFHIPAFCYYVIYGFIFQLVKAHDLYNKPLGIGCYPFLLRSRLV